jgi:long-chain fatty acid transport protein
MKTRRTCKYPLAGSVGLYLLMTTTNIFAAGFYAPPKGAVGVGSANIGNTARASDASTVFFNPAGMTQLTGTTLQGGIDFITPDIKIRNNGSTATLPGTGGQPLVYEGNNGSAGEITPVPNLYFARPLHNENLWFGFALTAPFGLSLDYGNDWYGRYDSINNELATINLAPSLAYKISDAWSIGAGVNVEYADAKLSNALPNPLNPGGPTVATDALGEVTGDAWDLGFNIGLLYRSESTQIGVHYRSGIDHRLDGKTTISNLTGPLEGGNGTAESSIDLAIPAIASIGLTYDLNEAWKLLAEVQWFNWKSFDEIRVEFDNGSPDNVRPQGFKDTFTAGLGLEYQFNPRWTMRTGIQFDQSPTVDAFRNSSIPDSDQVWIGFGASYWATDRLVLDLGYVHSDFDAANINLSLPAFPGTPVSGSINAKGRTDNKLNVLSFNVGYRF